MTQEPHKTLDLALAQKILPKAVLKDIGFFALEGKIVHGVSDPKYGATLQPMEMKWTRIGRDVTVLLPVAVHLEHVSGDDVRETLAVLRVGVRSTYGLSSDFEDADDDALEHFIGTQARMAAWPYQRAEIQALSTKLGFPPLTLPLLFLGQTVVLPVSRIETDQASAG